MASDQLGPLNDLLNNVRTGALSRRAFMKRAAALGVGATFAGGLLDACGSSPATTASTGKVTLDFWTWVPGIDKPIDAFNKSHPDIHINLVTTPTGGNGMYTKLLTAIKAGNPPDLAQEIRGIFSAPLVSGLLNSTSARICPTFSPMTMPCSVAGCSIPSFTRWYVQDWACFSRP